MADTGRLDELKRKFDENPKRYFAPLANEYRKAGDPELAIELCRTYLPQQPTHMSGYIVYGQALHDAGHPEESAAVFKQALTLDPENIIALRHLGDISRDAEDQAGALRWYGKVLELDPRNEEIAAYVISVAEPGSKAATPSPERQAPPSIRPEPEPDASAVRLEDIFSEPDVAQTPFGVGDAFHDGVDENMDDPFSGGLDEPFTVTEWPDSAEVPFAPTFDELGEFSALQEPRTGPIAENSPFVTETMAELYVQQGLRGEALAIYRQLALLRDDPDLRQRIADLESDNAPPSGESVRAFFSRIGAMRPTERVALAADRASALSALFGLHPDNADLTAAQRLAGAFGNPRSSDFQS